MSEDKDHIIQVLRKEIERLNGRIFELEQINSVKDCDKKPLVIVTGGPRRGTSMMMHCLELGGIKCAYSVNKNRAGEESRIIMRNPKGFYEGGVIPAEGGVAAKRFGMTASNLTLTYDVYFIVMERPADEIMKSWNHAKAMKEGIAMGVNTNPDSIENAYQMQLAQLKGKKHLIVNYNEVNKDPLSQFNRIKEFIPFEFDAVKASSGVDKNIYIDRSKQ